jgi:hypothetical protein
MKLAREETRIMVTSRNFYHKNNLKFKGRNRNRNRSWNWNRNRGKKIGNRNQNLGKMARFRNAARRYQNPLANNLRVLARVDMKWRFQFFAKYDYRFLLDVIIAIIPTFFAKAIIAISR